MSQKYVFEEIGNGSKNIPEVVDVVCFISDKKNNFFLFLTSIEGIFI